MLGLRRGRLPVIWLVKHTAKMAVVLHVIRVLWKTIVPSLATAVHASSGRRGATVLVAFGAGEVHRWLGDFLMRRHGRYVLVRSYSFVGA